MGISEIFAQLGADKKELVHLSVTPGVGLELIKLDNADHSVKNYSYRPLGYNESLRQIADMSEFKQAVTELFEELNINIKSNIVLNLPTALLGAKELSILLGDDAVTTALTADIEQSYLFKRYEPIVSWVDSVNIQTGEMRKLFYSAMQKNLIDDISSVLTELGATLVSVKVSVTSLLNALEYSGLTSQEMQENVSWNLMLVNSNGYSICSMMGKNLVDYYEEPLAVKSFEGEEIYNAIGTSAQITLMNYPANSLFIISETDIVSAEILAKHIQVDCPVRFFENNGFKKENAIPVSLEVLEDAAHKISLEAIGIGSDVKNSLNFEFLGSGTDGLADDPNQPVHIDFGGKGIDISPNAAKNIALGIGAILLIPMLAMFIMVPKIAANKQAELDDTNNKLQEVLAEIKKLDSDRSASGNFDTNTEIKKVLTDNRSKLMAYTAIGDAVPAKVWLTYFNAKDDGKFDIKGEAKNVEDIYTFFRNMKDSLINTQLRLHKLELKSNSPDDAVSIDFGESGDYEFEITNMNSAELSPSAEQPENAEKEDKEKAKEGQ